jgi:hypothetical protein
MVTTNIKASYWYKIQGNKPRKILLLFADVLKKFIKVVKICEPPYIQAGHGTQLSKSVLSLTTRHRQYGSLC